MSILGTDPFSEKPGDRIGRYELLEKIGEGGCGVVYLARQDTPVRRQVAIKVIKLGMDTKSVIARFAAEQQALAMMDHPSIAKVFDANATVAGRPYFVMEWVRGLKITEYGDQHQLSTRERLELVIQVCQAVQHAHQKGIIHRDLKPSNILVTVSDGVPIPKVIDFGIAKATEGKLTDQTLFTTFEQLLGTPAYMSPEQAAMTNVDIDTRSDIYSLGVLLYELLTGTTPFDTKTLLALGVDELRRTIREKEPPKPSTRLSHALLAADLRRLTSKSEIRNPGSDADSASSRRLLQVKELIPQVRGDLDWIVMKCLEKNRARRYETANGLAADLKRHLNNEPVVARPPSRLYEFQKTLSRHKVGFAAAAAVVAVLVAGVTASTWQAIRATRLRQQAEAEFYTSDMNLAYQAWLEGSLPRAQELLNAHIPEPGQPDLRGFEWRYLGNLCRDVSLKTVSVTNDPVRILVSSPSHSFVAACCENVVQLLHPTTGNKMHSFPFPNLEATDTSYAIALSSGATNLLAAHRADGVIALWDVARQELLMSFKAFPRNVAALALSPDGRFLVAADKMKWGSTLALWNISSPKQFPEHWEWTNHQAGNITAVAFSPDGQTVVATSHYGAGDCAVWEAGSGRPLTPFSRVSAGNLLALALSPDGSLLATSGIEGRISILDFNSRTLKFYLEGHAGGINSLTFTADGQQLISAAGDGTVRIWDIPSRKLVGIIRSADGPVRGGALAPDGKTIFSTAGGEVKLWSANPQPPETLIETKTRWSGLVVSPDGKWLIVNDGIKKDSDFNGAQVWDLSSRTQKLHLVSNQNETLGMAFSPDSRWLALGDVVGRGITLWETRAWEHAASSLQPAARLETGFEVGSIRFSPDGIMAAAGRCFGAEVPSHATNRLAFWEVGSWKKRNLLRDAGAGPTEEAAAIAFSNHGSLLAIGYRDGCVRLWDYRRARLVKELKRHADSTFGSEVEFSPDDHWLASLGDSEVTLYDLSDPEHPREARTLRPSSGDTYSAIFTPDNKSLVTHSNDGLVKFWNLRTFRLSLTLRHGYGPGGVLAFAPDGNLLVSEDANGTLKLWPTPPLEEIDEGRKGR
ncbi:MAG: serine/threonine-protein kinase [Verrucomicrobiota bacterium]